MQLAPIYSFIEGGVFFQDTGIIIGGGNIFKSVDYFQSYTIDSVNDTGGVKAISFPNRNVGYIVGGSPLKTTDGGNTWNYVPGGHSLDADILLFTSDDTGYISSSLNGGLGATYDGGSTWVNTGLGYYWGALSIHVIHDSIIYIFGGSGILRSSNYGTTWQLIYEIYNPLAFGDFHFLDDTTIILSISNTILKSVNGGISFDTVMLTDDIYYWATQAIAFSGHDTGFVAFSKSIYKTCDAGNTWTTLNFSFAPDDDTFNTIHFLTLACSQNVVVGCTRGDIYKMEGGCSVTGIQDIHDANSFTIYPNPATNKLYGTINNPQKGNLQIFDIDGREVLPPDIIQQSHFEVDVSNLPAGLYFLVLQNDEGRVAKKFVKE